MTLIAVALAYALFALIWPGIQERARAADQRARHAELLQARARWEASALASYRLSLQLKPPQGQACEMVFEVRSAGRRTVVLDTCAMSNDSNRLQFIDTHGSVPDLFNYIADEIDRWGGCGPNGCACDGRRIVDVLYDRDQGYPQQFAEWYQDDWTTQRFFHGCSMIGYFERPPFVVSVSPLE